MECPWEWKKENKNQNKKTKALKASHGTRFKIIYTASIFIHTMTKKGKKFVTDPKCMKTFLSQSSNWMIPKAIIKIA